MTIEIWREMAILGKKLVDAGLTTSRFGNMSIRSGDLILITETGSMLDQIDERQIVDVDLTQTCLKDALASTETCVHRAIYLRTNAKAVIHTHPPYSIALSLLEEGSINPVDSEGMHFLGEIPIVYGIFGTEKLAENVSLALLNHKSCIARGHGVFSQGESLKDAYTMTCISEHSAKIKYLVKMFEKISSVKAT
ncbi:MAG: aldolase [Methanotrichaceae archaeon]|nr:aldolase [Methanotrichaceae archaeon]